MQSKPTKTFFGHPFQLSSIFHIELWERFSYYGMQAILLYYLYFSVAEGGLGIDKNEAGGIVAVYAGSVYLATLLGGWFADRVIGTERTLFYSGITVMLGHIALAILPGTMGLIAGLVLIALGSGGVKASASAMVGALYEAPETKQLRDAGFSIFYLAINIGALFGPLFTGYLQTSAGFHYGFGIAAIGMAFGLWQYSRGRKQLPETPAPNPLQASEKKVAWLVAIVALAVIALLFQQGWVHYSNFKNVLFGVVIVAVILYFARLFISGRKLGAKQSYILAYVPLFLAICVFWSVWYQVHTAVAVYFEGTVDRMIGGFEVPPGWLGSIESLWVICLASSLAWLWTKMGDKQPKTPLKFALSLFCVGGTYACFLPFTSQGVAMPFIGIVGVLFLLTIAELLISPISLSLATKIAPEQFKTQMVALNFLAISLGITSGGKIFGAYFDEQNLSQFFMLLTQMGVITGAVLLLLVPVLNRLLKGSE
ncbi:MAG: oligopeptide:H+ symporter [Acinetobacter sp.]|nr:oligopeptide:H+ symporter [Acinetobacter sp.]